MVKTKIIKRRIEIKVAKKKHNLIRCKCVKCGEKKWSQYNKKSNKKVALFIINLMVWTVAIDGITNWYESRGVWVFENAAAQVENQAQDQSHERSEEAPMEDGTSRGTNTVSVVSETEADTHAFHAITPETIETKIASTFAGVETVALAVAKGESGLDPNAKGWNCRYWSESLKRMESKSCKPEDRHKAWSVDCGLFQINHIGKECPAHLFNPTENIEIAKGMWEKRGFSPWVAYWNGQYKNHL